MPNIKFSITIPSYKTDYLHEAIESCLSQTYNNLEVIVVDDASPNDITSVVREFDDNRLRFYRNEKNCGALRVVDNWNICLGYCTGDYVICIGDDDRLTPECLAEYVKLIEKYPGLAVYHGLTDVIDEKGNIKGHQQNRPEFQSSVELILQRWNGDIQFIGDFCYDTNQLRADGGYYIMPLAWGSDDITAVRATDHNGIANTQISCFQYRENTSSITSSKTNGIKLQAKAQEQKWYTEFLHHKEQEIIDHGTKKERDALAELKSHVFYEYFHGQIDLHLSQFLAESLRNLSTAMKMAKDLNLTRGHILYVWHKELKKKLGIKI